VNEATCEEDKVDETSTRDSQTLLTCPLPACLSLALPYFAIFQAKQSYFSMCTILKHDRGGLVRKGIYYYQVLHFFFSPLTYVFPYSFVVYMADV